MAAEDSKLGMGVFDLTPHKVAICHLVQVFAPPAQTAVPIPFNSISHHNRLGLFLFSVTRTCDYFVEPLLEELTNHIKVSTGSDRDWFSDWLGHHLKDDLLSFSSPDDLFNFFDKLRAVLPSMPGVNYGDDRIFLDPCSHLGVFVRSCILAFNLLTFEGVCHLLTSIGAYCNASDASDSASGLQEDEYNNQSEIQGYFGDADVDLDNVISDRDRHELNVATSAGESLSTFHFRAPKSLYGLVEDIRVSVGPTIKHPDDSCHYGGFVCSSDDAFRDDDPQAGLFLRSKWQVQGYLNEQADLLEKHSSSFSLNSFNVIIKQLQKMAPELHRVRYLQYLSSLCHDDYLTALENLHSYFDYSAGMEGVFTGSPHAYAPEINFGRYQSALLCLGTMHCHLGHPKQALEALTEAVRISQMNNDDACLAYTLASICDLLSEMGISSSTGIIGSPYMLGTNTSLGMPLSTQQQLLVLLKRSQKRAEDFKLTCLVGFNCLALAKFDMKNVTRPLLSFGFKAPLKLKTSPITVCKKLRLSSYLFNEFGSDEMLLPNDSGNFSTAWIKNLPEPRSYVSARVPGLNDYEAFNISSQPNPIPGSVLQLAGASFLLRATSWELYGSFPLARINALIHATSFADAASSAELSLAYVKLIQYLAEFKGYEVAFKALKLAEEKFLSVSKSRIHLLKLQLLHEHALHRGCLKFAQQVCNEFGVLASTVTGVDVELKIEASLRLAQTLLAAKQFSQAAAVAQSVFCTCHKYNLQIENATVLLLLAEIHKKAGNAVRGLPYALASLSFCQSFNLDLLEASATLTISELWLSLGSAHAKRASSLANRCLPLIFGHGGLQLRARANIIIAKCHLSDPDFSVREDSDVVIDSLNQVSADLDILQYHEMAAEAFYLLAIVYNMLGKGEEREKAAFFFKKQIIALENPVGIGDNQLT